MPHLVRYALSLHLDLEERQIHVIAPDVGGGFGIKNIVYPEEIAVAAVARHLRYPLRWIEDRREHLLSSIHCRDTLYNRSEEHTSELQSLMRISYAVFCLKKKTKKDKHIIIKHQKYT